jgi:hypothetical protein
MSNLLASDFFATRQESEHQGQRGEAGQKHQGQPNDKIHRVPSPSGASPKNASAAPSGAIFTTIMEQKS